jgi:hypothetical protein
VAAEAEGLPRGPSEIKALSAVLIPIHAVKGMAGNAPYPAMIIKDHIARDAHGRDAIHRM